MIILHNNKKGNNYLVAKKIGNYFNCLFVAAEDNPSLENFSTIILIVSNVGDEELPQPMEDYLFNLKQFNKKYLVCELGNYFGFENYCGSKKVACQILDSLGWIKISEVSLDSLPKLDLISLEIWLNNLNLNFV